MIKIQNIYHMLAYAFKVLKEDGYANLDIESFHNAGDLLSAILAKGISNQVKRGLGREYLIKKEALNLVHGKIDIQDSIKKQAYLKKQLICEYDELLENNYLNKILKTTSMLLISSDINKEQKKALKKVMLFFNKVEEINPYDIQWSFIKYHRNNATYKMLINICYLVIKGMLLTEKEGHRKLSKYIDNQLMSSLYERFVREYYKKHYPNLKISASHIKWDVDDGYMDLLPIMKTDVTIEYEGKILIIDTKYYEKGALQSTKTIHSNNLYQIFTYVKNKNSAASGSVSGILLYGKTDEDIELDSTYMMNSNKISVKTLDLNKDFLEICLQLDMLLYNWIGKNHY